MFKRPKGLRRNAPIPSSTGNRNSTRVGAWQSYHGTVKPAGVPVLWFRISMCFRFWSKTSTKRYSNNFLLSREKTISSLLDLIGHVLLISEYETLHKQLCNITCQKIFFPCTLRLVKCFQFKGYDLENGTWRWKSRYWFCSYFVYFPDLKTIYFESCHVCCSWKLF